MLKCRDVSELATRYMEGELSLHTRLAMRLHLTLCSMCRAYMDQLHKTTRLLRTAPKPPPAPEVEASVVASSGSADDGG